MALIFASTSEPGSTQADGLTVTGAVTRDTEKQFDGRSCWKGAKAAQNRVTGPLTAALGTTYYFRSALRFSSVAPSANFGILRVTGAASIEVSLNTTGKIGLFNALKGANVLANVFAPEAERTYLYELKVLVPAAGNGTLALRIYNDKGETVYESGDQSAEIGNTALTFPTTGHIGTETNVDVYISHFVGADSTGGARNTWQGFEKLVELLPVEDGTRVGWTTPGGGTTELVKALDNRPAEGIADTTSEANKERQIRDPNNNATDTFIAVLGAYTSSLGSGGGGLAAVDTVNFTQARARGGSASTTSRTLAVRSESNPGADASEGTAATGTTTAGTEPTGWTNVLGTVNYAPSVTLGTKPSVRVRKGTASTTAMLYDQVGLIVGFVPGVLTPKTVAVGQAVETDAAQSAQPRKRVALGQPSETDTVSGALLRLKRRALGQATEADTISGALGRRKTRLVEQVLEADLARALAVVRTFILGRALEADAAQALSRRKARALVQVTEVDAARALVVLRRLGLAGALEVDLASPMLLPVPRLRPPFGAVCFGETPTLAVEVVGDRAVVSFVDSPTAVFELPARIRLALDLVAGRGASSFGEEQTSVEEMASVERGAREL